jgi:subfamily B ATP-binding cassette protein MsbA
MNVLLYKRLIKYLQPFTGRIVLAIACSVVVGLISTSPVPIIQKTFDEIFVKKDLFMLKVIPLALVLMFIAKAFLTYFQNIIIFGISWELIVSLRREMYVHVQRLPLSFFEEGTTGHLMSKITNDVTIMQSTVTNLVKEMLQNSIMLVGLLCWLFYLKWDWALMALIIFPLGVAPVANIARKLRRLGRKGQELLADITAHAFEAFSGVKIVRAFGLEDLLRGKFDAINADYLKVMRKNVKYVQMTSPFMEVIGAVSGGVILWFGGIQVFEGKVSQGTFIAFIVALFMMYAPVRLLFKIYANFQTSLSGAERVFEVIDRETESVQGGQRQMEGFHGNIEFRNVSFKYPSRNAVVLKNINIDVKKSEVVALVGMSGAGKTTLVDLLFRFFPVTEGEILIDGINIAEYNVHSLRKHLALVTQETFLFNDTIWNNIAFGHADASPERIMEAARAAHVDYFAANLDDKYNTIIGERGVKLSGGQRQRIAIARAILRNAPILILDEATSALDSESEKLVQDALNNLMQNRTSFVIAHRLSTIKHANRIVVVDAGRIVEAGTHEELISHSGIYQKYYEMQFMDFGGKGGEA